MSIELIGTLVFLLTLLALSAFFSGSETALFSLPRVAVDRLGPASRGGKRVAELLAHPNRLLVTILLGNLTVNVLISEIIGVWAFRLFGTFPYSDYVASLTAIFVTTIILLVFAEIAPKTVAIKNAERFALGVSLPLKTFSNTVSLIISGILLVTDFILRLMGVRKGETDSVVTEEELKTLIAMSEEEGVLEPQERLMIHRIIEFGDTLVRDVFIPREDMVVVREDSTIEQVIETMKKSGHSRFPVCRKTGDDIEGIIHAKDLFLDFRKGRTDIPVSRFSKPPHYVRETENVRTLLKEFQSGRRHMAIVVDEGGRATGLVTLEDLLEEVVGEIFDEYDVEPVSGETLRQGGEPES